ncbi:MAG: spore coat protein [Clostridia bacterium]|jgi:dTDP-glucose 4,6-dehydratase|nr:spore coat protein [Clostridia bacterium]
MQVVVVTGGAGFIGSNFIKYLLKNNKELLVINIDKLTYAGSLASLQYPEELLITTDNQTIKSK